MGWSQGGYISAFLTTHERQIFKAISVGAGISNWMTYYVNTDIGRQRQRRSLARR
jgi:dipeptidyl aminopeptidase/acylaminoacyl peptidase